MREIIEKFNVYKFHELPESIQDKVIENLSDINTDYDWWDSIYEDAKNIGLQINEFDCNRLMITGDLLWSPEQIISEIIAQHGESCETYKDAIEYKTKFDELEKKYQSDNDYANGDWSNDHDDLTGEFKHAILENYLSMLRNEYDYRTSREAIIEAINANEFEFKENGKIY